jgi:hypothetical protein
MDAHRTVNNWDRVNYILGRDASFPGNVSVFSLICRRQKLFFIVIEHNSLMGEAPFEANSGQSGRKKLCNFHTKECHIPCYLVLFFLSARLALFRVSGRYPVCQNIPASSPLIPIHFSDLILILKTSVCAFNSQITFHAPEIKLSKCVIDVSGRIFGRICCE